MGEVVQHRDRRVLLLAGYIVYKTGRTDGIADIDRAVADVISALTRRS
ncbi:MAG: hypothetical protein K0U78_00900 [Actinomycetia bacterium]|nr:hypothetical protein [Actinomycetes bacterium]